MSLRALIADDSPLFCELIGALLGEAGFSCAIVADGRELVEMASQDRFDIIVTDVNMANMDGLSAVRRIRETLGDGVPVVVVSGEAREGIAPELHRLGIAELVQKPFTAAGLVTAVWRAVASKAAECARPMDRRVAHG